MRRNMELIRSLLLKLEEIPTERGGIYHITAQDPEIDVAGFTPNEIDYHLHKILEAGLIVDHPDRPTDGIHFSGLSWAGHDFIDSVRDEDTWAATSTTVETVGGFTFAIMNNVAKAIIKSKIATRFGLEI
jgi:hypothetical protein